MNRIETIIQNSYSVEQSNQKRGNLYDSIPRIMLRGAQNNPIPGYGLLFYKIQKCQRNGFETIVNNKQAWTLLVNSETRINWDISDNEKL